MHARVRMCIFFCNFAAKLGKWVYPALRVLKA